MQLISKFNKGIRFLLCTIDIFSKYTWIIPLEDKKSIRITNAFQKVLDEYNRKPNKIWVDKGSKFYNSWMKPRLEKNAIEMYSTYNEAKSVVADKLDYIVNKDNNTYRTIKMKPVHVKSSIYIDFNKENKKEDPKFKVSDHVRVSKYKNIFAKGYVPNWCEEVFVIKKVKNTVPWTYVISDLKGEEIVGTFYEKELQKTNQKEFRVEKVIKR